MWRHVTPLLRELHWLRVPERITFRLATLAYSCQHNMAPHYLAVQLNRASSVAFRQRLRSASTSELIVPRTVHSAIGDRAFCVTAARAWNTLTLSVQSSESLTVFRRGLRLNRSHAPSQIDYISVCSTASWLSLQSWSSLDYNVDMTFRFNNNNNNNVRK